MELIRAVEKAVSETSRWRAYAPVRSEGESAHKPGVCRCHYALAVLRSAEVEDAVRAGAQMSRGLDPRGAKSVWGPIRDRKQAGDVLTVADKRVFSIVEQRLAEVE